MTLRRGANQPLWTTGSLFATLPPPLGSGSRGIVLREGAIQSQDTWPNMKSQQYQVCAVLALAVLLTAAAPPSAQQGEFPSTWSRIVAAAKRFARDPLGRTPTEPPTLPPQLEIDGQRAGSVLSQQSPQARRDQQVKPATAVETVVSAPPAKKVARPQKAVRTSLFSRDRRPTRTISEYMAEEKP